MRLWRRFWPGSQNKSIWINEGEQSGAAYGRFIEANPRLNRYVTRCTIKVCHCTLPIRGDPPVWRWQWESWKNPDGDVLGGAKAPFAPDFIHQRLHQQESKQILPLVAAGKLEREMARVHSLHAQGFPFSGKANEGGARNRLLKKPTPVSAG